jgi:hypothetical protein
VSPSTATRPSSTASEHRRGRRCAPRRGGRPRRALPAADARCPPRAARAVERAHIRARGRLAEARTDATGGQAALARDERPLAAAGRGLFGPVRVHPGLRRAGLRPAVYDGCSPSFQQPQDRRLRTGAAHLSGALGVCGIMGFKNDTPFSVGRDLRDTMSACLMVANERFHQTNASLLLIAKEV